MMDKVQKQNIYRIILMRNRPEEQMPKGRRRNGRSRGRRK
jgi:hypothetical protein